MMTPRISPALLDDMNMIGLRLVAAMSKECAPAKKSDPIPIKSRVGPTVKIKVKEEVDDDDVELSESYTCVISRLGATVKKREYVNGYDYCCGSVDNGIRSKFEMNSGVILEYSPMGVAPVGDFLSYCCLCRKRLRDLDIFMYRGQAFCSEECRCQQIMVDENKEKYASSSKTGKRRESPITYLNAFPYNAGVAAA